VYVSVLLGAYGTRTILYWRRIVLYATADTSVGDDLSMFRFLQAWRPRQR
jgi:hypothetical protein